MVLCRETSSCEKRNKERDDGHVMYYQWSGKNNSTQGNWNDNLTRMRSNDIEVASRQNKCDIKKGTSVVLVSRGTIFFF